MRYALVVTGPAYGSQQATSAWQFANALIEKGHRIESVFFYQGGVQNANRLVSPASDEFDLVRAWQQFSRQHSVVLNVCVAAALRRGVIDAQEAQRRGQTADNLQSGFTLSGLGELAQAALTVDRVIQF
ncbi:sulfurtransferase complex subunit TusD [Leminorella richardii]|uniref:sulfurtransferase complex subunit TusD n=1 Tax=Leminorella richardii TaxID=158841 RepID=UPI000DBEA10F|nr:sulfurtransferase complex subunit TusD [Leminorella richardii]